MSIGGLLDSAAAHLAAAEADILAHNQPQVRDIIRALAARDLIYLQLARLTALIRNRPPPTYLTWADAEVLLGADSAGRHIDPATVLAAGLHVARLDRQPNHHDMPTHESFSPDQLTRAADLLAAAGEIIATHTTLSPVSAARSNDHDDPPEEAFRTAEGAALSRGTHRREALGEIARFACLAVQFDQTLLRWRSHTNENPLHAWQWRRLHRWVTSDFPKTLAALGSHPPAVLLRELRPVPIQERPAGPHTIASMHDIHAAVAAARIGVRHHRSEATIGLVREIARLGFALNVAASRANGETEELSPHTEHHGATWRALAAITTKVSDIRERPDAALHLELRSAAAWLRDQLRSDAPMHEWADHRQLTFVQRDLQQLCLEAKPPLRFALAYGQLMTPAKVMTPTVIDAVRVAQTVWHTADYDHPHIEELHRRLSAAGNLSLTLQQPGVPAVQTSELSAQPQAGPWTAQDQRTQRVTSIAYPHPTNTPLSGPARRDRDATRGPRHSPLGRGGRQR